MRQDLRWAGPKEFTSLNTRMAANQVLDTELTQISNYTFDELGGIRKIRGNNAVISSATVDLVSQEDDTIMVDAYWDGSGVHDDNFLKSDFFAMKFPDAFFTLVSQSTVVSSQLALFTSGTGVFTGTMYQADQFFTEVDPLPPTFDNTSQVDIVTTTPATEVSFNIPTSWIADMQNPATNFGFAVDGPGQTGFFISSVGIPPQFGTGVDGNITVRAGNVVDIADIYNNDNVTGVTTSRGVNKGLNHSNLLPLGVSAYDPENGIFINALDFTVENTSTLTVDAWNDGTNNRFGIIWVASQGSITIDGLIEGDFRGGRGGTTSITAIGNGIGIGGNDAGDCFAGAGLTTAAVYGDTTIATTVWTNIYGSGGREGGDSFACNDSSVRTGGAAGFGGGAVRLYAASMINVDPLTGTIRCTGGAGGIGQFGNDGIQGRFGCFTARADGSSAGGGSGGSIYLESLAGSNIGISRISCNFGLGNTFSRHLHGSVCGDGAPSGGGGIGGAFRDTVTNSLAGNFTEDGSTGSSRPGTNGSLGRIHVVGPITGSSSSPPVE